MSNTRPRRRRSSKQRTVRAGFGNLGDTRDGLEVATDDAVDLMLAIASGELIETEVAGWLIERLQPLDSA